MKRLFVLLTVAVLAMAACSKSDDDPQPTDNGAAALYARVLGKWSFSGVAIDAPRSTGRTLGLAESFIEFLSDSTYYIYDANGGFFTGTFAVEDTGTIKLGDFGVIRSMTFAQASIDFILTYDGKEVRIAANKASAVVFSDTTKLFCRKWRLTREFDGHYFYNAARGLFDAYGEPIGSFVPDSIIFQITPGGTYVGQMFREKALRSVDMFNWKWHSTLRDYFVFWDNGYEVDEVKDKAKILELNKDVLRFSQGADYNGDGVISDDESSSFRLVAVDK